MKTKTFLTKLCAVILLTATVLTCFVMPAAATETTAETETNTPFVSIDFCNLSFQTNVCIKYAVKAKYINNLQLLIWTAPQDSYVKGTETYTLATPDYADTIDGEEYYIFDFTDLVAKEMTDYFYAVAYSVMNEVEYYSNVVKYSVLQYGFNIKNTTTDQKLVKMVNSLLAYGAAAQEFAGYKTDTLANASYAMVQSEYGVLEDGFSFGLLPVGTSTTFTAKEVPAGATITSVSSDQGFFLGQVFEGNTFTVTAPTTAGTTASYKPEFTKLSAGGNFIYELDGALDYKESEKKGASTMAVDGVIDAKYNEGIHLESAYSVDEKAGSFDLYMVADAKNVYVLYDFHKVSAIRNYETENYTGKYIYHFDCADFVLNLTGAEAIGSEFHILGYKEGGAGTAVTNNLPDYIKEYYVKHASTGYDYTVEFAIPINSITGRDENGNRMFSFTAVSTMCFEGNRADGSVNRVYPSAYKAAGAEAKANPSVVVIKEPTQAAATTPTKTDSAGDFVYEISRNNIGDFTVDGLRDDKYATGVHQVSVANMAASGTYFDVYYAADKDHVYVLYEFTKREQIFYRADYGSKYHEDCADFVLNLAGTGAASLPEFRILAGVEGGPGTAVADCDLKAKGLDNWYVKHTYNGYNVEFSIPVTKITGADANGNLMVSFTACSTVTTAWTGTEPGRVYTTANSASGKGGNDAKATPNYLVIKNDPLSYELKETTDSINYTDGVKDAAYDTGLHFAAKYFEGAEANWNDTNTFDFYMTADADYVYGLFIVKDDSKKLNGSFVKDGASYWYNDCAEIMWDTKATVNGFNGAGRNSTDVRFFANTEGTNHYGTSASTCDAGGGAISLTNGLTSYTVVHTEDGYNVEFVIARSAFTNKNVFTFVAMATFAPNKDARTYTCIENGNYCSQANNGKRCMNTVTIVK